KINLTLDVKGLLDNGFHEVEMIMQQILLCDDISMIWEPAENLDGLMISLSTNRKYLPTNERNLAYKAAIVMWDYCMENDIRVTPGRLTIHIKKRIPVAAGLAGGSGNGGAVLHGLNVLWNLGMDLRSLCEIGKKLGSDVPFCIMGQAAENRRLKPLFADDPLACHCALASGTGTELKPLKGLESHLILSKPAISVSTAAVYKGIDSMEISSHPDTDEMIRGLSEKSQALITKNLINVLENYTLKEYPIIVYTKNKIAKMLGTEAVLMSGSGPTVFGLCQSRQQAQHLCGEMKKENRESFWTRTTF
ncbi:MAG: hypothetical protein PHS19_06885, partial [Eubacteriales bacterium]|nr:hypothetical protein [Eubacteriales bacterium]